VGIDVEGDGGGGVTQPLRHHSDGHTRLEQMGGVRVAQIVKADDDAMLAGERCELAGKLRGRPGRTVRLGEDEVLVLVACAEQNDPSIWGQKRRAHADHRVRLGARLKRYSQGDILFPEWPRQGL